MEFQKLLQRRAREVIRIATDTPLTIATAESLTAGMTSAALAGIPGASAVLRGGAVTYCDEIKHRVLSVSQATLDEYTAVSGETACEMAQGARELFGCDIAVSLTGYAGPDGGDPDSLAGTVYIGVSDAHGTSATRHHFDGSRNEVRIQAAAQALALLLERMANL